MLDSNATTERTTQNCFRKLRSRNFDLSNKPQTIRL